MKRNSMSKIKRIRNFLLRKISKVTGFYTDIQNNNAYEVISRDISRSDLNEGSEVYKTNPMMKFIKNNHKLYIEKSSSASISFEKVSNKAKDLFYLDSQDRNFSVDYRIATSTSKIVLASENHKIHSNEVYRYIFNPLLALPEILELITSDSFKNVFYKYKDISYLFE